MAEIDRFVGDTNWIGLEFVERDRMPTPIIGVGIRLHLAGLPLSNTKQALETLGVGRSRTAIHNGEKADLRPTSDGTPNRVAVDETVIRINDERHWLYAAVDSKTNDFLHVRLFPTRTTELVVLFLRELRDQQRVDDATFLVDAAPHLATALDRPGLRFRIRRRGNRNGVERIFREVKRRTSSFSNTFSNAKPTTAESWLQAFALWWNRC
jgi:putative transposase